MENLATSRLFCRSCHVDIPFPECSTFKFRQGNTTAQSAWSNCAVKERCTWLQQGTSHVHDASQCSQNRAACHRGTPRTMQTGLLHAAGTAPPRGTAHHGAPAPPVNRYCAAIAGSTCEQELFTVATSQGQRLSTAGKIDCTSTRSGWRHRNALQ